MNFEYITTSWLDYPSNSDIAVVVFIPGCDHSCNGCHNTGLKEHKPHNTTVDELVELINSQLVANRTNKLVITGGDPLSKQNAVNTQKLLDKLTCDVIVYTGHRIDHIKDINLTGFTYVKCGLFDMNKQVPSTKTDYFMQLASTNQGIYDNSYQEVSINGKFKFKEQNN